MTEDGKHALVFGASGLVGWGVVDQLLSNYHAQGTFRKVTALVNRPFDIQDSLWPKQPSATPKVQLVSGVNLTQANVENLTKLLKASIEDIEKVTQVFYFVYKSEDNPEKEVRVNCKMLECAVGALNELCPKLEFLVFPSGTKAYGIHIPGGVFTPPYEESMGPLPDKHQKSINYPVLRNVLERASAGKHWTWCDIRPDAVVSAPNVYNKIHTYQLFALTLFQIGFVPNGSAFNLTAHWATYLSLYALVQGKGAKVPFPGTLKAYNSLYNEASAEMIAKCSIWAALHPDQTGNGQIFNIADQSNPESMRDRWPALAAYFGLEGTAPVDDGEGMLKPSEYIKKHYGVLEKYRVKSSPVFQGEFLDSYGYYLDFDRHLSLEKVRKAGFTEAKDPNESWFKAFDRFKRAGMIAG
ncbi:MAG: hypothetical protein LQ343_003944 [Gyalolechia ehrenbergii]|nr:MAG: hypothetical protein LQ343_003944 [Gyalolechia ehrenbergii]